MTIEEAIEEATKASAEQAAEIERLKAELEQERTYNQTWREAHELLEAEHMERGRKLAVAELQRDKIAEALRVLLMCPAIADADLNNPEWGDSETAEAEAQARAALASISNMGA